VKIQVEWLWKGREDTPSWKRWRWRRRRRCLLLWIIFSY